MPLGRAPRRLPPGPGLKNRGPLAHASSWLLLGALVLFLLALAVKALAIVTVQAYKAKREGWWLYLIAIFLPPLDLVAVIAWFVHLRRDPLLSKGRPF